MTNDVQPWQWPDEHWRRIVDHVRAGRTLKPASWPGGARCAVALSFDSDHETNELREGGESIGKLSQGQYGNRQGVPRILDIFRRELEAAHAEGGIFQLTMHPHISGYRSRIWILEEIIKHAKSLGSVWFATHADIARHAKLHAQ